MWRLSTELEQTRPDFQTSLELSTDYYSVTKLLLSSRHSGLTLIGDRTNSEPVKSGALEVGFRVKKNLI